MVSPPVPLWPEPARAERGARTRSPLPASTKSTASSTVTPPDDPRGNPPPMACRRQVIARTFGSCRERGRRLSLWGRGSPCAHAPPSLSWHSQGSCLDRDGGACAHGEPRPHKDKRRP